MTDTTFISWSHHDSCDPFVSCFSVTSWWPTCFWNLNFRKLQIISLSCSLLQPIAGFCHFQLSGFTPVEICSLWGPPAPVPLLLHVFNQSTFQAEIGGCLKPCTTTSKHNLTCQSQPSSPTDLCLPPGDLSQVASPVTGCPVPSIRELLTLGLGFLQSLSSCALHLMCIVFPPLYTVCYYLCFYPLMS